MLTFSASLTEKQIFHSKRLNSLFFNALRVNQLATFTSSSFFRLPSNKKPQFPIVGGCAGIEAIIASITLAMGKIRIPKSGGC